MTEHPILFSAPMVRAILEGRKTQTRRVVKGFEQAEGFRQTLDADKSIWLVKGGGKIKCPYGQPGDRLWVRETWAMGMIEQELYYRATDREIDAEERIEGMRWRSSIHMPRRFSRINLEITDIRAQRLQDISEEDAKAEGAECLCSIEDAEADQRAWENGCMAEGYFSPKSYTDGFQRLWDSINAKRGIGWDVNPWVWAVSFRRVK